MAALAAEGVDRVIVAHADLPLASSLAFLADGDGVTLVPDRREDGTNVACVPSAAGFRFAYGPGRSTATGPRPTGSGSRCGSSATRRSGWDVDVPDDLDYAAFPAPTALGGRCP